MKYNDFPVNENLLTKNLENYSFHKGNAEAIWKKMMDDGFITTIWFIKKTLITVSVKHPLCHFITKFFFQYIDDQLKAIIIDKRGFPSDLLKLIIDSCHCKTATFS